MKWSKYQKKIFDTLLNEDVNMVISAVAGSGKTTTIEQCLNIIPDNKHSISLAFNNLIVKELRERIKRENVEITTMHSFCWKNLMRHYNYKVKLNKNKVNKHLKPLLKKFNVPEKRQSSLMYVMNNISSLIRQHMIDVNNYSAVLQLAEKYDLSFDLREYRILLLLLNRMDRDNYEFDFTDMIYRAVKDNIKLPKFDFIFVDEAQDLSKTQQIIISRIKKRKGRMVAVGDPAQAIYGFAGADNNSYENLKNIFPNTIELPLSVNYRCGKAIVKEAQNLNSQIKPYKKSPIGEVREGLISEIHSKDWVLSRNLKPLVQLNMYFLAKNKKSFIKGIDIGMNLANLVKKTGRATISAALNNIESDIEKAKNKLRKRGVRNPDKTSKIDNMYQKLDVLQLLSKNLTSTNQLINRIKSIFKEQGDGIMLSTIHKAKGLENDNVFILSPELIPSRYAVQPWQIQQEWNLMYVAITRAKKKLIYIDNVDFFEIQQWLKKYL